MPTPQSAEVYQLRNTKGLDPTVAAELNATFTRLSSRLNALQGLAGTPTFYGAMDMRGNRLARVGTPQQADDAQQYGLSLSLDPENDVYNAQGRRVVNAEDGLNATDMATVQQLLDAMNQISVLNEPFVTVAASTLLRAERVLTPEAGVLTVTDGGANSTITVGVATNGITDAKFRQSAGVSVVGRSANSVGNVADIVAGGDNQLFGRFGGVLSFSASPTLGTSLTVPLLLGGTAVGSALTLQSTSGAGTTDYIDFLVGNNGATRAGRITTAGFWAIGATTTNTLLGITGASWAPGSGILAQLELQSTDTLAADAGAGLVLSGVYTGSSRTQFAQIRGVKENATDGNYAGNMILGVRQNGGNIVEGLRISSGLNTTLAGSITTVAPSPYAAGTWKLGVANAVSPTAPDRTITIDIDGTAYFIHAKTTND